ncbi:MAG: sugar phosphate isomerase/epimerase family protein [Candidatus Humimicrobiaceae bacterium]
MNSDYKISTNCTPFSKRLDRFVPNGYTNGIKIDDAIKVAGEIDGLKGLEFLYPVHFKECGKIKKLMESVGLRTSCVQVDLFIDKKWKFGSLSSMDASIRKESIELSKCSMDIAAELGANRILLWLGQDGYDYTFQTDYQKRWNNLINSLSEITNYRSDIKVSIEYKIREPRVRNFLSNMGTTLVAIKEVNMPNLGVLIDIGHSFMAYENIAEMALLAYRNNALHGFHLNDCSGYSDDDLVLGTIHLWEYIELFYWMLRIGYNGWWTLDTYPYREDGVRVIKNSLKIFYRLMNIAKKLDTLKIEPLQMKDDSLAVFDLLVKSGLSE